MQKMSIFMESVFSTKVLVNMTKIVRISEMLEFLFVNMENLTLKCDFSDFWIDQITTKLCFNCVFFSQDIFLALVTRDLGFYFKDLVLMF